MLGYSSQLQVFVGEAKSYAGLHLSPCLPPWEREAQSRLEVSLMATLPKAGGRSHGHFAREGPSLGTVLLQGKLGDALPSCLSTHIVNKCPFLGLFNAMFSRFSAFGGLAVENGPNCRGEVPPSAPESKKVLMCLMEKHVPQIGFV